MFQVISDVQFNSIRHPHVPPELNFLFETPDLYDSSATTGAICNFYDFKFQLSDNPQMHQLSCHVMSAMISYHYDLEQ